MQLVSGLADDRKQSRAEKRAIRNAHAERVQRYYHAGSSYGMSVVESCYLLASEMGRGDNDLLWCATFRSSDDWMLMFDSAGTPSSASRISTRPRGSTAKNTTSVTGCTSTKWRASPRPSPSAGAQTPTTTRSRRARNCGSSSFGIGICTMRCSIRGMLRGGWASGRRGDGKSWRGCWPRWGASE